MNMFKHFKISFFLVAIIILSGVLCIDGFADSGKLQVLFSSGGSGNTLMAGAKLFEEKFGVEVEVLTFPIDEVREKQILALTQGRETPDVIAIDDTWFAELVDFLYPLEVDENTKARFVKSMLDSYRWPQEESGTYYGFPVRMAGDVIVYREDILAEHNINPEEIKTWEDFVEVAIRVSSPQNRQWGYVQGFTPALYLVEQWLSIVGSYGVDLFTEDYQRAAFNNEMGIQATKVFVKLVQGATAPGILSYGYNDQVESLQTGMAAMSLLWTPRFQAINDPSFPFSGKFKILPNFPYGKDSGLKSGIPLLYGWGVGINKYSKNIEIAKKFVDFMASEDTQLILATEYSNTPTVEAVFNDSKYQEIVPFSIIALKAAKMGQRRPVHIKWNQVEHELSLQVTKAIKGDLSVEEALSIAEKEINKILSGN